MRRLEGRKRMLVDQLHLPTALEDDAKLIEAGDGALEHDAIDEEQGHSFLVARRGSQKQVLQGALAAVDERGSRNEAWRRFRRHDGGNRMLVHELRCAFPAEQERECVEPGYHTL